MHYTDNASHIFPPIQSIPQILGKPRLRQEVLKQIKSTPSTYAAFQALSLDEQEALLEFCMGNRGLKVTYDPFFQHLFNPSRHRERLERMLSCFLEQSVQVLEILPRERFRISENSSLMVMDILVKLTDGSLANLEMQRIGYDFPGERTSCYGADLLVRQYDYIKEQQKKKFSYRDMKPIYVIVLMEKSPQIFHKYPDNFIHRSLPLYDTGLRIDSLINFIYIPLDIFRKMPHNEITEMEAWLYFLSSDNPDDIRRITQKYPFFRELYQDIIHFRYQPKELISMFSEALRIMDQNTITYMIDELKEQISRKDEEIYKRDEQIFKKDEQISRKDEQISQQEEEISRLRALLQESGK